MLRKYFIPSHLQKFTPPVSDFMRMHPFMSYTLTCKGFTFSWKKSDNSLLIWTFEQLCRFKSGEQSKEIGRQGLIRLLEFRAKFYIS